MFKQVNNNVALEIASMRKEEVASKVKGRQDKEYVEEQEQPLLTFRMVRGQIVMAGDSVRMAMARDNPDTIDTIKSFFRQDIDNTEHKYESSEEVNIPPLPFPLGNKSKGGSAKNIEKFTVLLLNILDSGKVGGSKLTKKNDESARPPWFSKHVGKNYGSPSYASMEDNTDVIKGIFTFFGKDIKTHCLGQQQEEEQEQEEELELGQEEELEVGQEQEQDDPALPPGGEDETHGVQEEAAEEPELDLHYSSENEDLALAEDSEEPEEADENDFGSPLNMSIEAEDHTMDYVVSSEKQADEDDSELELSWGSDKKEGEKDDTSVGPTVADNSEKRNDPFISHFSDSEDEELDDFLEKTFALANKKLKQNSIYQDVYLSDDELQSEAELEHADSITSVPNPPPKIPGPPLPITQPPTLMNISGPAPVPESSSSLTKTRQGIKFSNSQSSTVSVTSHLVKRPSRNRTKKQDKDFVYN